MNHLLPLLSSPNQHRHKYGVEGQIQPREHSAAAMDGTTSYQHHPRMVLICPMAASSGSAMSVPIRWLTAGRRLQQKWWVRHRLALIACALGQWDLSALNRTLIEAVMSYTNENGSASELDHGREATVQWARSSDVWRIAV
jgi:hypothetical protein